jgi:hypothetical protein
LLCTVGVKLFYTCIQWCVATLFNFNECDTSFVFKNNTWYVAILLDACVK